MLPLNTSLGAPQFWEPSVSFEVSAGISTRVFPAGRYRFHVEDKKLEGGVIQTATVDFDVKAAGN